MTPHVCSVRPLRSLVSSEVGYRAEYINNTTVNLVRRAKVNKINKRIKGKRWQKSKPYLPYSPWVGALNAPPCCGFLPINKKKIWRQPIPKFLTSLNSLLRMPIWRFFLPPLRWLLFLVGKITHGGEGYSGEFRVWIDHFLKRSGILLHIIQQCCILLYIQSGHWPCVIL